MNTEAPSRHIGRKIWYGTAITLCCLLILVSAAGIAGSWVLGNALTSLSVQVLTIVDKTAGGARLVIDGVDEIASNVEDVSTSIGEASDQLSQSVTDRGLILTLLPEEKEQELEAKADELTETIDAVLEAVDAGLDLYLSIDALPFVSLPMPRQETLDRLEQLSGEIQTTVDEIVQGIQDFRSGVSSEIDRVTELALGITGRLGELRDGFAMLDADLAALQELIARLQRLVATVFTLLSLVSSLFLAWAIYTQVEVIRLYVHRWKSLGLADEPGQLSDELDAAGLPDEPGTGELEKVDPAGKGGDGALPPPGSDTDTQAHGEPESGTTVE
jgi:hypothetical protein